MRSSDSFEQYFTEKIPGNQKYFKEQEGDGIEEASSQFSGDIEDRVMSMIEKSKNHIGYACFACEVCGKKGYSSSIKNHIERIHLEGFILFVTNVRKLSNQEMILKGISRLIELQWKPCVHTAHNVRLHLKLIWCKCGVKANVLAV